MGVRACALPFCFFFFFEGSKQFYAILLEIIFDRGLKVIYSWMEYFGGNKSREIGGDN